MTPAEQIAWHRSEADRIEAEERARRPALRPGQVWTSPNSHQALLTFGNPFINQQSQTVGMEAVGIGDGEIYGDLKAGAPDHWSFVGLARDVLRVVPPDPPAPQVAPEPTGAELVGRRCWVRDGHREKWEGPFEILKCTPEDQYMTYKADSFASLDRSWWAQAKPYVEGVAP